MIRLGVVGIPTDWEARFLPAIRSLAPRVKLCVLFDHVAFRAQQESGRLQIPATGGVISLASRADVDGILVLKNGWPGMSLWPHISTHQKPVFVADFADHDTDLIEHLHATSILTGTHWMPDLRMRYFPSTSRLMELIATECGPVKSIQCQLPETSRDNSSNRLCELIDWCRYVLKSDSADIISANDQTAQIIFRDRQRTESCVSIEFAAPRFQCVVQCKNGVVTLVSNEKIHWQAAKASHHENLAADRSATHVMLDHFCRRVAGGLVPNPTLAELHSALVIRNAISTKHDTQSRNVPGN